MSLDARVTVRLGALDLDATVRVAPGETVAILGPNGAGKTTFLRALAGLSPLDAGRIELDGTILDDAGRVFVTPERRSIGVVFQDYLLFPHLSAVENVAFGLRSRGMARTAARLRARRFLETVGLGDHADSRPAELSGGQAQRVALARALATDPRLLLLDEPLAALDRSARTEVQRELRSHLRSFDGVRLLVTHDPLEAAALADHLVILEDGRITQTGTFAAIASRPRSRYGAELVGVNLLSGTAHGDGLTLASGAELVVPDGIAGPALAVIHPHSVALHLQRPAGSARNAWPGVVDTVDLAGDRARVRISGPVTLVAEITAAARADLAVEPGTAVWASVKATDITVFPE